MWQAAQTFEPTYPLAPYTVEANKISPTIPHTLWRRLSAQCHLVFPDSGICLWGGPLACAGRPARLVDNPARSEERGWEPRADGASAPPKLSDIGFSICGSLPSHSWVRRASRLLDRTRSVVSSLRKYLIFD